MLSPVSQHWEDGEEAGGQHEAGNMPTGFFFLIHKACVSSPVITGGC